MKNSDLAKVVRSQAEPGVQKGELVWYCRRTRPRHRRQLVEDRCQENDHQGLQGAAHHQKHQGGQQKGKIRQDIGKKFS